MRPPERIPKLLELLGEYWKKNPELRLGQLILNLTKEHKHRVLINTPDVFYVDDDDLQVVLETLLKENT